MEILDSVNGKEEGAPSAGAPARETALDRLELKHEWVRQEDEQQVEETLNLYARAARQRMQAAAPQIQEPVETEEEREARSQQLKLQQKCQDIAALIMVDELEEEEE